MPAEMPGEVGFDMGLSNKIRAFRFSNGEMTQKQLAECVGVSRQTMNAIENCRHAPTIDVAIRIADVFGITVDELFNLDYEGKPVRHANMTPAAVDRPQVTIEEPEDTKVDVDPAEEELDMATRLANLRHVIG
jgi:putative transcriptional regulator